MNLTRGLFRLWLVLAAAFIVFVAIASEPKIERGFAEAPATADSAASEIAKAEDDAAWAKSAVLSAQFDAEVRSGRPHQRRSINDLLPQPHKPPVAAQLKVAYREAWIDLWKTVAVALGVPLLALAFGQGVLWAAAGFGRRTPPPTV
jgi:hypothetical protein